METPVPPPPNPALWEAVSWRFQTSEVARLLAGGADVDEPGAYGNDPNLTTPLQKAVLFGNAPVLQLLIDNGAACIQAAHRSTGLLSQAASNVTPLHPVPRQSAYSPRRTALAALTTTTPAQGHNEVVRILLQSGGVDVHEVDDLGFTPLIDAAIFSRPGVAALLLEHGANVLAASPTGVTALMAAEANLNQRAPNLDQRALHQMVRWDNAVATVAILKAEELDRAKCIAFAMGAHKRLGEVSMVRALYSDILKLMLVRA